MQREREREEEGGQKGYLIADLVQGREKEISPAGRRLFGSLLGGGLETWSVVVSGALDSGGLKKKNSAI